MEWTLLVPLALPLLSGGLGSSVALFPPALLRGCASRSPLAACQHLSPWECLRTKRLLHSCFLVELVLLLLL